jgi:hypothetical protein
MIDCVIYCFYCKFIKFLVVIHQSNSVAGLPSTTGVKVGRPPLKLGLLTGILAALAVTDAAQPVLCGALQKIATTQ